MAQVTFTYNPTPAPACYPPDINGLAQELTNGGMLVGTIPDTAGGGVFVGSSPPSSALTNKVWYKTDAAGRPLGVYMFYNGNWRRVYTGQLGEVRMFSGSQSAYFDGGGRGIVGGDYDGWAICNGSNGTPDLTDRFIIGGQWNGSAWVSFLTNAPGGAQVGGATIINPNNLPALLAPTFGVMSGPITGGGGAFLGAENAVFQNYWHIRDGSGNPITGANVPFVPPFFTLAYMMFVGYQ